MKERASTDVMTFVCRWHMAPGILWHRWRIDKFTAKSYRKLNSVFDKIKSIIAFFQCNQVNKSVERMIS